jgi:hypothetical protein
MIPASISTPPSIAPSARRRTIYRINQDARGHWCVSSSDGMTGGTFFERDAAIRFARRESVGVPVLVLQIEPEQWRGAVVEPFRGTISRS